MVWAGRNAGWHELFELSWFPAPGKHTTAAAAAEHLVESIWLAAAPVPSPHAFITQYTRLRGFGSQCRPIRVPAAATLLLAARELPAGWTEVSGSADGRYLLQSRAVEQYLVRWTFVTSGRINVVVKENPSRCWRDFLRVLTALDSLDPAVYSVDGARSDHCEGLAGAACPGQAINVGDGPAAGALATRRL